MTARLYNRDFLKGLQTSRPSDGDDDFTGFRSWQNLRVHRDQAEIRPGRVRLQKISPTASNRCCGFDGASTWTVPLEVAAPGPAVWNLGTRNRWTVELLVQSDLSTANQGLVSAGTVNPFFEVWVNASSKWEVRYRNLSAAIQTIEGPAVTTNVTHLVLYRDETSYGFVVDGTAYAPVTLTGGIFPSAGGSLTMGRRQGTAFYWDGKVSYLHLLDGLLPHYRRARAHLLATRQKNVLACYRGGPDGNALIIDHSPYEVHATHAGGISSEADLAAPHAPVQAIRSYVDSQGRRRLAVAAGGCLYGGGL